MLVVAQGALGGATVEENLEEVYVAAHLGLAMLLLGLLLYLWRVVDEVRPEPGGPRLRGLVDRRQRRGASARWWPAATWPGTQNYGRADYQLGDGAHHACGKEFPTCNGEFMPFGDARLVDIHLTHRFFMYIASALVIALVVVALRRRVAVRYAWALAALLAVAGAGGRAERLARRVRAADRAAPRARARCCGPPRSGMTLQLVARARARARAAPRRWRRERGPHAGGASAAQRLAHGRLATTSR